MKFVRILSICLVVSLLMVLFPATVFAADTQETVVQITHISLDPVRNALGFKAKVEGDVASVTEIGFCFRLAGGVERTYTLSKNPADGIFTARIKNILAAGGGEAVLEAYAFVRMGDVTVTSQTQSTSMKQALQTVDAAWHTAGYTRTQKNAIKAMCEAYKAQTESWALENIFGDTGAFFGRTGDYQTDERVDLSADTGANTGTVTVAQDGVSFGYLDSFREENFYFEAKIHVNGIAEGENWPKFGLFVQAETTREYYYVDMSPELTASVVGRMTSVDGQDDWSNAKYVTVNGMAFSGQDEKVTLGILKDGKRMHLFVNGVYAMSSVCSLADAVVAGIFSFNTGMTVTEYYTTSQLDAMLALVPEGERNKGELFGFTVGDGVLYGSSDGIDLSGDEGEEASVAVTGGGAQFTYLNDVYTDKFCFETEINVSGVFNNDSWPKFGIMVNGTSEMVKFYVDMTPSLTSTYVGVVYQPTGGGDDWGNAVVTEVPGMSFSGSDTVKLKLIRNGKAYAFYVDGKLVLSNTEGFHDDRGTVGIFSFNSQLTASNYNVTVGDRAMTLGLTCNWFTDNGEGVYTLTTNSSEEHKVDDLARGGVVVREANYRVGGKLTLTDASDWGQARILISSDARNEYFIALEKLPAGNFQIFTMSKADQDGWDNWVKLGETGKDTLNFEVVVIGNKVYFLLNDLICYETDRVAMETSTVKFTGYNFGTTTVQDLSLGIFTDSDAAAGYIAGKSYKPEGVQETQLSTNYFTETDEGVYTLTTNSDAQHLVDDVLANGVVMRQSMYSLKGKLSLTDAADWGQARILISGDSNNEHFIALEKTNAGFYQIFTMSNASEASWNNWIKICDTGKNVHDFEVIVNNSKVYFLVNDLICYETDRVSMTESTVKFTGYNNGTTTVQDLQLRTFADGDALAAYVAGKEYKTEANPETLLSTNYFTETNEGVYTLTTNSDEQHKVDDVLADGLVMRDDAYSVQGKLSLTDAADWGQARILISADAQNEYFIALEKVPSGNYQIFTMSKAAQDNWDVWQSIADETVNGSRNSVNFELVVIGGRIHLLLDGELVYKTARVPMTESTVKFSGYNIGTTTVENLVAHRFATQAEAETYLMSRNAQQVSYQNDLQIEGADPGALYITEGKDAGSYYMYVTSDSLGCTGYLAYRSSDLVNWECVSTALSAGETYYDASTGRNIAPYLTTDYWAPEVIYDAEDKLYYMFYSADRYDDAGYLYGDIAVSADPAGPFVPYTKYLGKEPVLINANENIWAYKPVFDFSKMAEDHPLYEAASEGYMKVIDLSPFTDPVTGQKYMYFCHDVSSALSVTNSGIYAMKLNEDYTPDYTSVTSLTVAESALNEGKVNEAPYVMYKSGKYYLTYSVNKYYQTAYSVRVAVADSPMGPFTKLTEEEGGYLLSGTNGTGHNSVVSRDGQDYIVYHAHKGKTEEGVLIRGIAMDELHWVENANGLLVPVVNGPSGTDMPLTAGNYTNIAANAAITADPVSGSVAATTDGIIAHSALSFLPEASFQAEATIRLDFAKTTVYGVGVYDGVNSPCAGISSVRLILANGESICYTDVAADQVLKTVPVEAVAIEIVMTSADAYAISEIVVMGEK